MKDEIKTVREMTEANIKRSDAALDEMARLAEMAAESRKADDARRSADDDRRLADDDRRKADDVRRSADDVRRATPRSEK